jgi:L-seryl-tRNA(Ser) seleniumtransferase
MPNVYERLGVPTIINAKGPSTRLSGAISPPEVAEAMREAAQHCVDMAALQARASALIAEATGAEAGLVTSGAAAGLLLGTAACVAGLDPGKMSRLPDTAGMRDEVVLARSHRNSYDHAVRTVGVRLVEVGLADRLSGAGVRDVEAWEYAEAIGERTAMVLYVAGARSRLPLPEVAAVAKAAGVPVLVDAAAQLPPVANLRRYVDEGADLVAFSGGKAIRGPQASGILCGRRDLIMAAALQNLDMDVLYGQWSPPPNLIDKRRITGAPRHGIGRPCKAGKEEIVGLMTALGLFLAEDPAARRRRWRDLMEALAASLRGLNHARVALLAEGPQAEVPMLELTLDAAAAGVTAAQLMQRLQDGTPGIHADPARVDDDVVLFGPVCLKDDEPAIIGERVRAVLGAG